MTEPVRRHGLYGRLPRDPEKFLPTLEAYLTPSAAVALPPVPLTQDVDRASNVTSWPMYLNDTLGDCTIAGAGHMFGALSVYGGRAEPLFSDQVITTTYSAVSGYVPGDPSTDNGAAMPDVLDYLRQTGMTDTDGHVHKVAGYAAFGNPSNELLLGQVLDIFGTVYCGIDCPESAEQEFDAGEAWTYVPGSPIEGGHCIVLQRRYPSSDVNVDEFVTWGALQRADFGFVAHYLEEAYAVVSEDWIAVNGTSATGLDLAQLLADMNAVG